MSDSSDKLLRQAWQARKENRHADAQRDLTLAVDTCRKAGDKATLAEALAALGQIERDLQNYETASRHYEEAVAICREEGDPLRLAHTVRHLGDIHRHEQHREQAELYYYEALSIYRKHELTPPLDLANTLRGLALLKEDCGEADEAILLWQEARGLYAAVGVEAGVAEGSRRIALLAERQEHN